MTGDQLATIGKTMFGTRWISGLAEVMGLSARQVHRLVDGTTPVDDKYRPALHRALQKRLDQLVQLADLTRPVRRESRQ